MIKKENAYVIKILHDKYQIKIFIDFFTRYFILVISILEFRMPLTPGGLDFQNEWEKLAVCMNAMYSMTGCESISASSFMS